MARKLYDCMKCPGYCCSYPVIEVKDRDAERIAKHFDMPLAKAEKKFFRKAHGYKRIMRRQKDEIYGKICRFFDTKERRCTIYACPPLHLPRVPRRRPLRLLRLPEIRTRRPGRPNLHLDDQPFGELTHVFSRETGEERGPWHEVTWDR